MSDFNPLDHLKEIGGIFKFGSGVLGKSSIALGIFLACVLVAVWRLHSDAAIITTLVFAALVFFLWLRHVLKFSAEHPDLALLDGAEWTGWKRFEAAAKGYTPSPNERQAVIAPGTNLPELPEGPKSDDR